MHRYKHFLKMCWGLGCVWLFVLGLSACVRGDGVQVHGNLLREHDLQSLHEGSTQQEVLDALGTPSTVAWHDARLWYYVSRVEKDRAIIGPEALDQKVLEISFNEQGIVERIKTYEESDALKVKLSRDQTPAAGSKRSLVQRLFGGISSFPTSVFGGGAPN